MTHVLTIDQGTTGATCLVGAADGRIAGRAYREITQHYPRPGWVEHDATEILDRTVVPALVALGAPDWEPNARGTIVGLTRGATRAHLARAGGEMTYATRDVLDVIRRNAGTELDGWRDAPLRVDGGATANDGLMQYQADVLNAPVERPQNVETTALGAAGLAGLAAGVWRSPDDFLQSRSFMRFEPSDAERANGCHAEWRRAVRTALAWARDDD